MHILFQQKDYYNADHHDHHDHHGEKLKHILKTSLHVFDIDPYRRHDDSLKNLNKPTSKALVSQHQNVSLTYSLSQSSYESHLITHEDDRDFIFGKTHVLFIDFIRKSQKRRYCGGNGGQYAATPCGDNTKVQYNDQHYSGDSKITSQLKPTPLEGIVDVQEIPLHLRSEELSEIFDNMFVMQALQIIRGNIQIMSEVGLSSPTFIIYIVTYHLLLKELYKYEAQLNCDEIDLLKDLLHETEILYMAVNVNITNERFKEEVQTLRKKTAEQQETIDTYLTLIKRIEHIEVTFHDTSVSAETNTNYLCLILAKNGEGLKVECDANGTFIVSYDNPNSTINAYNILLKTHLEKPNLLTPVFRFKEISTHVTKDRHQFSIAGTGTSWAIVYYLMFGPNTPYTKERDAAVRALIKLSEDTGIPLKMLLPKVDFNEEPC